MSTKLYDISDWCKKGSNLEDYPYIGEVDIGLEINQVVEIDGEYYAVGVYSYPKCSAGVHKIEINFDPEERNYEDSLTCPYCGYEDLDSFELEDNSEEHPCSKCGGIISYERVTTIEYNTAPKKAPEVIKTEWV